MAILDELVPLKTSRLPRRPSNLCFDTECLASKQVVSRIERYLRACSHSSVDLFNFWRISLHSYRSLLRAKRMTYWRSRVHAERNSPKSLWKSINILMGSSKKPYLSLFQLMISLLFSKQRPPVPEATRSIPTHLAFLLHPVVAHSQSLNRSQLKLCLTFSIAC